VSRLLEQVREAIRTRHYSIRTEEAYIRWTREYILFCGKRHPSELGAADVSAFISYLAVRRKVAASTQTQALSALLFLYRGLRCKDYFRVPKSIECLSLSSNPEQ
jgi:integrase-like protein